MADDQTEFRSIARARDFLACAADGFTTTIMSQPPDASIQVNFWNVDGAPAAENPQLSHDNKDRYLINNGTILRAAVRVRPDVALQLAMAILQALTDLPEDIRSRYALPKEIHQVVEEDSNVR
jgi:hypothetical protein